MATKKKARKKTSTAKPAKKKFKWKPVRQVYKITYPTGKVYIGKDAYGSPRYMGSPDPDIVHADFEKLPAKQRRDFTVRKQILWESGTATEAELASKEVELIVEHRANDPEVGYNRWPEFKPEL